jgi:hypothetical protein
MKDNQNPFFRPLWLRVLLVAICFGWAAFELYAGSQTWALITAAIGAYAVWSFFITYDPIDKPPPPSGER